MPRPGPRPYECIRRAWHTEKHQPIRGSLIQEIFRIAHEIHSPATKKNKEWQEKLPTVVLKAEEIMYSKANSEAEYMDPKTLRDRVNDAINTIIRRDDSSTENEEFLQPCIEAALNLGCYYPRRSEKYNSPSCYLSALHSDSSNILRHVSMNSKCLENELMSCISSTTTEFSPYKKLHPELQSHSSYPLYLGIYHPKSAEEKMAAPECDLSLRLGPLSAPPCAGLKRKWPLDAQDIGLIASRDGRAKYSTGSANNRSSHFCLQGNAASATAATPLDSCL
ncbi:hypothetical protein Dimus_010243 [Dionaea muscipula]